ncbi:hypothetical protein CW751_00045 [Brumimicrobium salinarum]|uniref:Uncharacterized protein n=1 Tax=Brumimicrobium salinarum TaxID=2058658 RepID=A0A2I0R5A5_9FLAO|nr:hypothetical protein CW751_00045 [Brumimicrobium salinarum]
MIVYWFNYGEREYFRCKAKSNSVYEKSTLDFENIRWDSNFKKIPADQREAGISMLDAIQLDNYSLELLILF